MGDAARPVAQAIVLQGQKPEGTSHEARSRRRLEQVLVGSVIIAVVRPATHARPDQTNDQDGECAVEQVFQVMVHRPRRANAAVATKKCTTGRRRSQQRQPPLELNYSLKLLLRAIASFLAASAFAMLFNCSPRTVLAAGLLALGANSLRLFLIDMGLMSAPAAFVFALGIGFAALIADWRFDVPRTPWRRSSS